MTWFTFCIGVAVGFTLGMLTYAADSLLKANTNG